jgi:hypothetical protein
MTARQVVATALVFAVTLGVLLLVWAMQPATMG